MTSIKFISKNITPSVKQKKYITDKISKHKKLLEKATSITVLIRNNRSDHGSSRNIKIEVSVTMPLAFIRVEESGKDIFSIIDGLEVVLKRRLRRYRAQFKKWSKKTPWKVTEFNIAMSEIENPDEDSYSDYTPQIKVKEYSDDRPLHPAEAIEQMELLGHRSLLFKNIVTNKYSMVYKRDLGGYGLVQPKS